jgi:hypothetical protein
MFKEGMRVKKRYACGDGSKDFTGTVTGYSGGMLINIMRDDKVYGGGVNGAWMTDINGVSVWSNNKYAGRTRRRKLYEKEV